MPLIYGSHGADTFVGTTGDDRIVSLAGNDDIQGGDGNDTIIDEGGGDNVLSGGAGDDFIYLRNYRLNEPFETLIAFNQIFAGDGSDRVVLELKQHGRIDVDLGAGNDFLLLNPAEVYNGENSHAFTLGAGSDTVTVGAGLAASLLTRTFVIADFQAGAGGDVLNLSDKYRAWTTNPFGTDFLKLRQSGADSIVTAGNLSFVLKGVDATKLVAHNFAGFAPDGAANVRADIFGTDLGETIEAGATGGRYRGLGGNDLLVGHSASDTLDGDAGDDIIDGGFGNDILRGGDGNDRITDERGDDHIDGGAGNDVIDIVRARTAPSTQKITIFGGDGDDEVRFDTDERGATLTVDLGAGDDRFRLGNSFALTTLTLGTGRDTIILEYQYVGWNEDVKNVVVADFTAGDGGDIVDLGELLYGSTWNGRTNPFASGHIHLFQEGADTIVARDSDGSGQYGQLPVIRLVGIEASTLTAQNFAGFDPGLAAIAPAIYDGTGGADRFVGNSWTDKMRGFGGDDILIGGYGNDLLDGGTGNDVLEGGYGNDQLTGGLGDDRLTGTGGSDTFTGGDGNDHIVVDHFLFGGPATDVTTITGGEGNDVVEYYASGVLTADLGAGDDNIYLIVTPIAGSSLTLGAGRDTVTLNPFLPAVFHPVVIEDFEVGEGGDRLDWFLMGQVRTYEADIVDVGWLEQSGADTILTMNASFPVVAIFRNVEATSLTAFNLGLSVPIGPPMPPKDTLTGTDGNDVLAGTDGSDRISGLYGDDAIDGGLGRDMLIGGEGNDSLKGGGEDDHLLGDNGDDRLEGGDGADFLDGGVGVDTLDGGEGADTVNDDEGIDTILGGAGNDNIDVVVDHGEEFASGSVDAGAGNDTIHLIHGGWFNYDVSLGTGDDIVRLRSIGANATVTLGEGRDTIELVEYFNRRNSAVITITDFVAGAGGDRIVMDAWLGRQLIGWDRSENPFTLGYLKLEQTGPDVILYLYRTPGDEFYRERQLTLSGVTLDQLTAENFGGFDPRAEGHGSHYVQSDLTIAAGTVDEVVDLTPGPSSSAAHFIFSSHEARFVNQGTVITRNSEEGSLRVAGFQVAFGGDRDGRPLFQNAAGGVFIVENELYFDPDALLVETYGFRGAIAFRNAGDLEVRAVSGDARAVVLGGGDVAPSNSAFNSGNIVAESGHFAWGVELDQHGSFINTATGTVTVRGGETAVGVHVAPSFALNVLNEGKITASTDPASPYASIGILVDETGYDQVVYQHHNKGTITADYAYYVREFNTGGYDDVLTNSGTIQGAVYLNRGDDRIVNTGFMTSRTILDAGDDRYDGASGFHSGSVEGGSGNDVFFGGAGTETFFGDGGSDAIQGNGGDDYVDGGAGSDLLDGAEGVDTLSYLSSFAGVTVDLAEGTAATIIEIDYVRNFEEVIGSRAGDRISGSAAGDVLIGFRGDDRLDGRGGEDVLFGGEGSDLLTGGAGADRFLFDIGDGKDEVLDFAAGDAIEIYGYKYPVSVQQVGADVRITLSSNGNDSILVRNTTVAALTAKVVYQTRAIDFTVPGIDDETMIADDNIVIGAGALLALGDARPQFVFDEVAASHAVVLDSDVTVWNYGTIRLETTAPEIPAIGIAGVPEAWVDPSHRLVNREGGLIEVIAQQGDAIGVQSIGWVFNQGDIVVRSLAGDAVGLDELHSTRSILDNSGTIEVTAAGKAAGVVTSHRDSHGNTIYVNSGDVAVHGGEASVGFDLMYGVTMWETDLPAFVNSGTITVTDETDALDSTGIFFRLFSNMSAWNSGTITADYAIRFDIFGKGIWGPEEIGLDIANSGTLNGIVSLTVYNDLLINSGAITGPVRLRGGADVFDGRLGTLSGRLDGDEGDDILLAGRGRQTIYGGAGNDVISGGAGDDALSGGLGRDSFRFETGFGRDTIADFNTGASHDYLDVRGFTAWTSMVQSGADVLITFSGEDSLLVRNVQVASLTPAMIRFGAAAIAPYVMPEAPMTRAFTPREPREPVAPTHSFPPAAGTEGADVMAGTSGPDELAGLGGDDNITGEIGNDLLDGGAGNDVLDGGSGDDRLVGGTGADQMSGGMGNDHYVLDDIGDRVFEKNGEGVDMVESAVSVSLAGQYADHITLTGTANINATGNSFANSIEGNSGNNILNGGAGADQMYGLDGDDRYIVDNVGDVVSENGQDGNDTVVASISFTLGNRFENLTLSGTAALNGTGNELANLIVGNAASNRIDGGFGADTMQGGQGDDVYLVDDSGDKVVEKTGEGFDRVEASASFSLAGSFAEELALTGTAAVNGTGNGLDNRLTGNNQANILDGGAGADTLQGRKGDDTYVVDNALDKVTELDGEGSDTVNASVSYSLAGQYAEVLNLTGAAAINGTGNGLANRLVGNSAANTLNGGGGNDRIDGGAGADTMVGGLGNDVFVIDDAADKVMEKAGEGTDTIEASMSYSLAGQYIEILKLTGSASIDGTGNNQANSLTGNSGANVLDGMGGADVMTGGAGADRYIVDDAGDKVIEALNQGTDTVLASVSFSLAGQHAEILVLTGSGAINGTGNGVANSLTGNGAANTLSGGGGNDLLNGGLGADRLSGGDGADSFLFDTALGAGNVDSILDFASTDDTIRLDRSVFAALGVGVLGAGAFVAGTVATDADDRIVYDHVSGDVWYDADGSGAGAAVRFASFGPGEYLTAADFVIVA